MWIVVAMTVIVLGGPALAQTGMTDPAMGARRDAYGPGVHMDATGRPYRDDVRGGGVALDPIRPNAYGPGVGMDATGRPVRPSYDLNGAGDSDDLGSDDD